MPRWTLLFMALCTSVFALSACAGSTPTPTPRPTNTATLSPRPVATATPVITSYRAVVRSDLPVVPGVTTPLTIEITDQSGRRLTDFDTSKLGQYIHVAAAPLDLSSLDATSWALIPRGGMGGGGMGMGGAGVPTATPTPGPAEPPLIQPLLTFPKEGQYVVFVSFWPRGQDQVTLAAPFTVGGATTAAAALSPDTVLTQTVDDLRVTLKLNGALKANQYNYLTFDAVDTNGQVRTQEIEMASGDLLVLHILDQAATTYLRPDLIRRAKLQYSALFPKPGIYKAWFSFRYANRARQISFVLDVQ